MITSKDGRKLYRVEIRRVVYVLAADTLEAEALSDGVGSNPAELEMTIRPATEKKAASDGWTGHPFYSSEGEQQTLTVGKLIKLRGARMGADKSHKSGKVT